MQRSALSASQSIPVFAPLVGGGDVYVTSQPLARNILERAARYQPQRGYAPVVGAIQRELGVVLAVVQESVVLALHSIPFPTGFYVTPTIFRALARNVMLHLVGSRTTEGFKEAMRKLEVLLQKSVALAFILVSGGFT